MPANLANVHGRPDPAACVLGEHGAVVISVPIGVELSDHDVHELSNEQQRGGQAQRRALAECSVVHDHAPRLILRTTSKCIIIPAAGARADPHVAPVFTNHENRSSVVL